MGGKAKLRAFAVAAGVGLLWAVPAPAGLAHSVLPPEADELLSTPLPVGPPEGSSPVEEAQRSPALCGPDDVPEPGMQGQVPAGQTPEWQCGISPVGFLADAAGSMAVAGACAYTGGGGGPHGGVRVIDVSDPTEPELVRVLPTSARELLAARMTEERGILVTRHRDTEAQDGQVLGRDMLVDVWDIFEDCTDPQLLGTLRFPTESRIKGDPPGETGGPAHNLGLNPTATKVYGTMPLQEGDITDLDNPSNWTVRDLQCTVTNQAYAPYQAAPGLCEALQGDVWRFPAIDHEPAFNPDGSRLYVGNLIPGPMNNAMWILDMEGDDPVVVSVTDNAPGHSIDFFTVDGREYLLHSAEIGGNACIPEEVRPRYVGMGDRAWGLDITDETEPQEAAEILLAASRFENCGPGNTGGPSTAYHHVDDPLDSTYAVINFESAGFRFFDLRDPANPVEVAYFNHGRGAHTKPYIIPETGHIWVSGAGGFWVLELQPQVREHLGLDDGPGGWQPGDGPPPWAGPGTPEGPGRPR